MVKKLFFLILILVLLFFGRMYFMDKGDVYVPDYIGVEGNKFIEGPDKPNWVSSTVKAGSKHYIAPVENSFLDISSIEKIIEMHGGRINHKEKNYIHAIFKTKIFKFVDDVQIFILGSDLHMMSSSRVGHSDLGANRKRLEKLKKDFANN